MNDPLRPDERRLLDYHRLNLVRGGLKEGNQTTTFRGARIGVNGGTIYAPTYFNGKVNENIEDVIAHAKNTGLYAMYPNDKAAHNAEYKLHQIMERDTRKMDEATRPPLSNLLGVIKRVTRKETIR